MYIYILCNIYIYYTVCIQYVYSNIFISGSNIRIWKATWPNGSIFAAFCDEIIRLS